MKVLILGAIDTGGQGIRIREGFLRHSPEWTVDLVNRDRGALGYPEQHALPVRQRLALAEQLYAEADVVHLRQNIAEWRRYDEGQHKPTIVHHHGSLFRAGHAKIAGEARAIGAVQVASTLDLTLLEPDVEWLPSPYNLGALAEMKGEVSGLPGLELRFGAARPASRGESIRIAHFPTSPKIKSTFAFLAACARLAETHPVEVISNYTRGKVRHRPWQDVMAQKATADIYFDQVTLGYGNNAVEAWGMGIPVIAGVADPAVRALMVERFGTLPFMEATEQTIYDALLLLVESPTLRQEYAARGVAHAKRFHDDAVVVKQLERIYSEAQPTRALPAPVLGSRTWRARVAA